MAEKPSTLVLDVIKKDCPNKTCPYRYGDGANEARLDGKLEKKLKHRLADGNEVRALELKIAQLEKELAEARRLAAKQVPPAR